MVTSTHSSPDTVVQKYYYAVALSPDGNVVYQGETNGVRIIDVRLVDPGNPTETYHSYSDIGYIKEVWRIALSADGNIAYIANERGLAIAGVSIQGLQILEVLTGRGRVSLCRLMET